ncbi:hypothetical protein OF83DRAFT_554933 [Amylostereum chailletii]|nr:hypothetical protein OF83DRAFT_554933 [Amylostereum chailletii]
MSYLVLNSSNCPSTIHAPWAYTFAKGEEVWVKSGATWTWGTVVSARSGFRMINGTLHTAFEVEFATPDTPLAKPQRAEFSPADGTIKPHNNHTLALLAKAGIKISKKQ